MNSSSDETALWLFYNNYKIGRVYDRKVTLSNVRPITVRYVTEWTASMVGGWETKINSSPLSHISWLAMKLKY